MVLDYLYKLLEVKLPYGPVYPSVGWLGGRSVGRLVDWIVCLS